ncbi:selenocysteine lyase/cysteine desulfurase [Glaciihabitans tibetensis]|uniref:Selenocysteine lyase/cysteine desulfurase n=1 Tax=Glaciihabitans tibetensis TaxID=1266600 RepID=A0A2T0V475_9MICO|nr:aminotransferase class V-fold PLP-dependent enzyme [Glaciihabitans tibetensis]PRY64985.1 selenocysteine lyase/cysteine desulfurase [Glaciihabitans tibetensis]
MTAGFGTIDAYVATFSEEPGYFDFARVGPIGRTVEAEQHAQTRLQATARFGTLDSLWEQDARVREAVALVVGLRADQVAFQPNTSQGLMHALFGVTGGVAMSLAEFPSLTFAAARSAEALGVVEPLWLETDHGRLTPGNLRDQLTSSVEAVAVSLVDFRTGYVADLEGIRQVIGDRLLIVDAIQGFGVVDAPFELADVVVAGGQKWVRAGWGTGFLGLSDRAAERLTPVFSGFSGAANAEGEQSWTMPVDEVRAPAAGAAAFQVSNPDPIAQARFAAALEEIAAVGVPQINALVAEKVSRVIDLADEYAIPVVSPRDESERAGIVVLEPDPDQLTVLTASLFNHGVSATSRDGQVRLSPHVSTSEDSLDMLRGSFVSFATAIQI